MGREIVYCFKCARRLTGADFEKGAAFRAANRVACAECAPEATPESEIASPACVDQPMPRQFSPSSGAPGIRRSLIAAAAALTLTAILLIAGPPSGSEDSSEAPTELTSRPLSAPDAIGASRGPAQPAPERESRAAVDLEAARRHGLSHPEDLPGRIDRLTGVALTWDGTSAGSQAHEEAQLLRGRLFANIAKELEGVDREADARIAQEAFGKAFDLLTLVKARHSYAAWTFEVDRRIQRVEARGRDLFERLVEQARQARRNGATSDFQELRQRLAGWGWPILLDEFDRSITAEQPSPVPPSAEALAYLKAWEQAWIQASWGDFDSAERRLREAASNLREPGPAKEAARDLQEFGLANALRRLVDGLLSSASSGDRLALFATRVSGHPGLIEDPVYRAHSGGLEFKKAGQDRPYFIAFDEFDWPSRLSAAHRKTGGKEGFDSRCAALLCLLSGNAASAKIYADGLKTPLLARQVAFGEGPLPFSEGSASAVARHSRDASRLFYEADWEFQFLSSHAGAVLKYRELLQDYAATPVVRRNRELIERRSDDAREYVFRPSDMLAKGTFALSPWRSRAHVVKECWISKEDVDADQSQNNYVEVLFSPLPGVRYRCWVYAGGCCYESFTSYFQTTGYNAVNPETKNLISLEPGGNFALPLRPAVFLREVHSAHARRDEPKKPERWAWIEVPLADYAESSLKRIRLISDQKGFAVAYAIVSSTREKPPLPRELADDSNPKPAAGGREPSEWLLLGPFHNRGFGSFEAPEEDVALNELVQTKAGFKSWTLELARPASASEGKAAVLDFTQLLAPHEDTVVFALSHVWSPEDVDVSLLLGSDDGAKVWLNDSLIHQVNRTRGMKIDEDRIETRLRGGWNRFLIKVYQGKGGWGLAFRLTDRQGKPLPGLSYDPYGDMPGLYRK